jgi:nitronate monooxygenase
MQLNLRLPVIAAPMFLVSGPELVIAACRAGIVGAFPTPNCRTVEELDGWMDTITRALAEKNGSAIPTAPWAANLITHSTNARLPDDLALVKRYRPPLVITALGSPKPAVEVVHSYGGLVFADVINVNLARKAVAAGADGLVCIAAGAGGHTGYFSPFAFISAVREFFAGPIVIGGGISDGAGIAGAIAAGADYAYVGTRFLPTQESRAVDSYKQMIVDCGPDDLIVSAALTGTPASWLKPSLVACGYDIAALDGKARRQGRARLHRRHRAQALARHLGRGAGIAHSERDRAGGGGGRCAGAGLQKRRAEVQGQGVARSPDEQGEIRDCPRDQFPPPRISPALGKRLSA